MSKEKRYQLLSPQECVICQQIASGDAPHSQRAAALLALDEGVTQAAAAEHAGLSRGQLQYWLRKFRQQRLSIFPDDLLAGIQAALTSALPETTAEPALHASGIVPLQPLAVVLDVEEEPEGRPQQVRPVSDVDNRKKTKHTEDLKSTRVKKKKAEEKVPKKPEKAKVGKKKKPRKSQRKLKKQPEKSKEGRNEPVKKDKKKPKKAEGKGKKPAKKIQKSKTAGGKKAGKIGKKESRSPKSTGKEPSKKAKKGSKKG